jgi:hypothetical protein
MDSFYLAVLGIAVVLLILILTGVGIMMTGSSNAEVWPPSKNTCPDYWQVDTADASLCLVSASNAGTLDGNITSMDFNNPAFASNYQTTQVCALRMWALANGIEWDGVTNYNGC